eukprot:6653957-Lingulodinium_polyedra.AAC.1
MPRNCVRHATPYHSAVCLATPCRVNASTACQRPAPNFSTSSGDQHSSGPDVQKPARHARTGTG